MILGEYTLQAHATGLSRTEINSTANSKLLVFCFQQSSQALERIRVLLHSNQIRELLWVRLVVIELFTLLSPAIVAIAIRAD